MSTNTINLTFGRHSQGSVLYEVDVPTINLTFENVIIKLTLENVYLTTALESSSSVLQCVAMNYSVLQCFAVSECEHPHKSAQICIYTYSCMYTYIFTGQLSE